MSTRAEQRREFWTKGIAEFDPEFVRENFTCMAADHFPPVIIERAARRVGEYVHRCKSCGDKVHIKWIHKEPFIMKVEKL